MWKGKALRTNSDGPNGIRIGTRLSRLTSFKRRVDVIVAGNLESAVAARAATAEIPIVITAGGDPLRSGLVQSLAHPGGNVTGVSEVIPDLAPKLLQLLSEAVPKLPSVAVLWNPANPSYAPTRQELEAAAYARGIQLQSVEVGRPHEMDGALATITRERPAGLVVYVTPITQSYRARLVEFAAKRRLPAMYSAREFVDDGGLMSYGPNHRELFRRAANFIHKILRGGKPADLPIENPPTSNSSSTSRPPRPSASRSHPRCWRGRIKSSNDGPPPLPGDLAGGCARHAGRR
jgi:putative ABC transport system substrate-binding protein